MVIINTSIRTTIQLVEKFSQVDKTMQANAMLTLLYVAQYQDRPEGITTSDIRKWLGVSNASASRNIHLWGEGTADSSTSGFGMVEVREDPNNRTKRHVRLTPKGEAFIQQMETVYG